MAVIEGAVDLTNTEIQVQETQNFEDKETRIFKPETGKSYRIKFTSSKVEMRRRHFNPILKKYYRCLDHQGYCPICIAASNKVGEGPLRIKRASETFGANILVYDLDATGEVKQPYNAEVYFWAFGTDKFVQLRQIIKEWGAIESVDLTVTCTDGQFQKVTLSPTKTCFYATSPEFKAACDKKIESDSYPLDKFLCKEKSMLEMVKDFNLDVATYIPQEILAQMSGGQSAQSMANYPGSNASGSTAAQASAQTQQQAQSAQVPPDRSAEYSIPQASAANFANLEEMQSLL